MNKRLAQLVGVVIVLAVAFACTQATAAPKKEKKDRPKREKKEAELPAAAKGFAGMIRGKVLSKTDGGGVVLAVEEIAKIWKHSKATEPKSMVGKGVVVVPSEGNENHARFLKGVKVGEEIAVDVANKKGGLLTLLELTKDQREKIEKE